MNVQLRTMLPGPVELEAMADHRLMIHADRPVRSMCGLGKSLTTRGDLFILPSGHTDRWVELERSTSLYIEFSPALLQRTAEEMGVDASRVALDPQWHLRDPQIEHIGWALEAEHVAGYPSGRLYTESLSTALAAHLVGRYSGPVAIPSGLSKPRLRRVTEYIEENISEDLSLDRLAAVADVSVSHFKTLFRRSMGVPVHEYVIRRRVERARELLLRRELPASQVALEAGFAHQSHMAKNMRRFLGVTPSAIVRAM